MGPLPWPGGAASVRLVSCFFFFHGAFLFLVVSCNSWRSHCECFSRLSVLRRRVCWTLDFERCLSLNVGRWDVGTLDVRRWTLDVGSSDVHR